MDWEMFENLFQESYFKPYHNRAIVDEFESLYPGDMMMIEYYNRFIELVYYYMVGNVNALTLILKFKSRLCS